MYVFVYYYMFVCIYLEPLHHKEVASTIEKLTTNASSDTYGKKKRPNIYIN